MAPVTLRPRSDRAFERMYRKHVHDVYRYAFALMRNEADAEDVTQTAFLNAYGAFERGERPDVAKNWLITITHNVCRQRFRNESRRPQETEFNEELAEAHVPDDEFSAEDIRRALSALAFNQRAALVARELEGRSYAEIAEIMGLTVGAVETLIFRARRALREQLEGTLTCGEAEFALSKQADGQLDRAEKGQLRAHLRECKQCASLAKRQRAQRSALLNAIGAVPLPWTLASFFGGGGGAALGVGVVAKTAAVVAAGTLVAGGAYEGVEQTKARHHHRRAVAAAVPAATPIAPATPIVAATPRKQAAEARRIREDFVKPHRPAIARYPRQARGPIVDVPRKNPAKQRKHQIGPPPDIPRVTPVHGPRHGPTGGPAK